MCALFFFFFLFPRGLLVFLFEKAQGAGKMVSPGMESCGIDFRGQSFGLIVRDRVGFDLKFFDQF